MIKVGDNITLSLLGEIPDNDRVEMKGVLLHEFELGGVTFLRDKKKLINTGIIKGVDFVNNILHTANGSYKMVKND